MSPTPDREVDNQVYEQVAQEVGRIVSGIVNDTRGDDLDTAVDRLHERLNAVEGVDFNRAWCQQAVEALRRGDALRIVVD